MTSASAMRKGFSRISSQSESPDCIPTLISINSLGLTVKRVAALLSGNSIAILLTKPDARNWVVSSFATSLPSK